MINPNEIRLGNIFMFEDEKDVFFPRRINPEEIYLTTEDPESRSYYPVKITGELLLFFGFSSVTIEEYQCYQLDFKNCRLLYTKKSGLRLGIRGISQNKWIEGLEIKTLHHLQNIFFALTGQELEYRADK